MSTAIAQNFDVLILQLGLVSPAIPNKQGGSRCRRKLSCGTLCQGYCRGDSFIWIQNKTQNSPVMEEKPVEGI